MKSWVSSTLTAMGGVFLVLVLLNMYLYTKTKTLQVDVNNRQQFISQSVQLEQLNKQIIMAIANQSVKDKDAALSELLTSNGITINTPTAPATEPPSSKK